MARFIIFGERKLFGGMAQKIKQPGGLLPLRPGFVLLPGGASPLYHAGRVAAMQRELRGKNVLCCSIGTKPHRVWHLERRD